MSGGKGWGKQPPSRHAFKVLCPEPLVASVMGTRGSIKDQIQEETGCKLIVSNREEYFPDTRLRILCIYCDSNDGITSALERIVDHIGTCGEKERNEPNPHFAGSEPEFLGKEAGEFILRAAIPHKASGAIIGSKGANVQAIRKEFNAKIFIEKHVEQGHQVLKLVAGLDNMRAAIARVNDAVQEDSRTDAFRDWSQVRSFSGGAAADNDGHRGGHHGGQQGGGNRKADVRWGEDEPTHGWEREHEASQQAATPHERHSSAWVKGGNQPEQRSKGSKGGRQRSRSPRRDLLPPPPAHQPSEPESLDAVFAEFPEGTLEVDYAISCDLPRAKVSAMIGKGGEHIKFVQRHTRTTIKFDEGNGGKGEGGTQTMMVKGHLANVYKAHALMMKRYHEDDLDQQKEAHVQGLQEQLAELQKQLESATKGKGGGKRY